MKALGELAPGLAGHRAEPAPCGLRLPHVVAHGAPATFVAAAAADGVGGERLAQHVGQRLRGVGRRRRRFGEEAFDLGDQLLHLLAAGFRVELGAAELIGMADHDPLERGDEPLAERIGAVAHHG